jgi:prepilin-type N-terminal cleavage/methylation domain-containing protein
MRIAHSTVAMVRPEARVMRGRARERSRRAGFTLTELLIVVAVIAITTALAGPALYTGWANQRSAEAGIDLVMLVNRARAESGAYGRAHLLRFDDTGNGSFELYRGVSSTCSANAWDAIVGAGACGAAGSMCVRQLDFNAASSRYLQGGFALDVTTPAASKLDVCYEPSGRVMYRLDPGSLTDPFREDNSAVDGGFVFTVQRVDGGTPVGVARRVALPLGADARIMR